MTLEQMSYLLAFVSAIATLAGLGFAFYGFYNISHAERIVAKKIEDYLRELEAKMREKMALSQEATQKIIAAYDLSARGNHAAAIELLKAALAKDPDVFNGYTALGYEYWAAGKPQEAIACFFEAVKRFPTRAEPYNDLARVYAQMGETSLALQYIDETLKRNPLCLEDIEQDPVFEKLRTEEAEKYQAIRQRHAQTT